MSVKEVFTADEWQIVGKTPFMAGIFISGSDMGGPIGLVKEVVAATKAVQAEATKADGLQLVKEIQADLQARVLKGQPEIDKTAKNIKEVTLAEVNKGIALVDSKVPDEAEAFRAWLFTIGQKVAEAAKEGGFAGFGGTLVSEGEKAGLTELAAALGVANA